MIKTQMALYFSSSSLNAKRQWNNFCRVLKERDFEPKILYKISYKGK